MKRLVMLSVVVCFLISMVGCGREVNLSLINMAKESLGNSLTETQDQSEETKEEIKDAYTEMKEYISEKNLTDQNIIILESRLDSIKSKHKSLVRTVNKCKSDGSNLFKLLTRRANENKTKNLRNILKDKIRGKQKQFENQIVIAEDVCEKVAESVQKYDDLVGYFQVNKGLDGVDEIIEEIDGAIQSGNILNKRIDMFVKTGMSMIDDL